MSISDRFTHPERYARRQEMLAGLLFFKEPADLAVLQSAARAFIEAIEDETYTQVFLRAEEPDFESELWLTHRLFRALAVQGGWHLNLRPYFPRRPDPDTDPDDTQPPQRERPKEEAQERAAGKKKRGFER